MRRTRVWFVLTSLLLACASCGGGNSSAGSPPPSPSSSPSPSPSRSQTVPAYLAKYTVQERMAYAEAVAALHRFTRTDDRILGQGKLTSKQAAFYRRNSINWVEDWANLAQLVNKHIVFKGTTKEVWVRPLSINLNANRGELVELRRCLDQSALRVFASGTRVPQPQLKKPHIYGVTLEKRTGDTRWRVGLPKQGATC